MLDISQMLKNNQKIKIEYFSLTIFTRKKQTVWNHFTGFILVLGICLLVNTYSLFA